MPRDIDRWAGQLGLWLGLSMAACAAAPTAPGGPSAAPSRAPSETGSPEAAARPERASEAVGQGAPPTAPRMVRVPAGPYWTGCDARTDPLCRATDRPLSQRDLPAFDIDVFEVTVRDYAACVEAGRCGAIDLSGFATEETQDWMYCNWGKAGKEDHPLNCVSWIQADAFCRQAGKRLPTEAEWEKAARGTDQRAYPWGDDMITCDLAVTNETGARDGRGCGLQTTQPVGSRPKGVSPFGVHDIVGNVWEWTADAYVPPAGAKSPTGDERIGKGGCWGSGNPWNSRISWSHHYPATYRNNVRLGFRCARSVESEPAELAQGAR